jgi:hypothetical protein
MNTFVKALAIAAVAVTATAAQAQLYGEIGYTPLKFSGTSNTSTLAASPKVIGLTVGYDIYKNVAVEGLVAINAGDDTAKVNGASTPAKLKVSNTYGIFVKPKAMLGESLEVSARFGYMSTKVDVSGAGISESVRNNGFAYGLGANYYINTRTYLALNYTNVYNKNDGKVDGFTFGIGMKY